MEITNVEIRHTELSSLQKYEQINGVLAYVTITLDDCFVVRDIRIVLKDDEIFTAMPSNKLKDGTFRDVAHPINSETRKYFDNTIMEVFTTERLERSMNAD